MTWLSIAVFGAVGALLRYGVSLAILTAPYMFPVATFIVNIVGCYTLGLLTLYFVRKPDYPDWLKNGIKTGLLGSFTTLSTFSLEAVHLFSTNPIVAVFYILISGLLGLLAAWLGMHTFGNSKVKGGETNG